MKLAVPFLAVVTMTTASFGFAASTPSPSPTLDQLQSISRSSHDFAYDAARLAQEATANHLSDVSDTAYRVGHHAFHLGDEAWNVSLDLDKSPESPHRIIMDDEYHHATEEFASLRTLVETYASSPQAAGLQASFDRLRVDGHQMRAAMEAIAVQPLADPFDR